MRIIIFLFLLILLPTKMLAVNKHPAITQPIPIAQLGGYSSYPKVVQNIIGNATQLTQKNLTYEYGSADPNNGGMDCSGTIYYLLQTLNIKDVPRDSNGIYQWAKQKGKLYSVQDNNLHSSEFANLQPGDLLFWTGTYKMQHAASISHVMIYLGKNKQGQPLMFGASDGRTYQDESMWGVSVFDFLMPRPGSPAHFVGYSCIPGLTC